MVSLSEAQALLPLRAGGFALSFYMNYNNLLEVDFDIFFEPECNNIRFSYAIGHLSALKRGSGFPDAINVGSTAICDIRGWKAAPTR